MTQTKSVCQGGWLHFCAGSLWIRRFTRQCTGTFVIHHLHLADLECHSSVQASSLCAVRRWHSVIHSAQHWWRHWSYQWLLSVRTLLAGCKGLCLNPDKTGAIVTGTGTRLISEENIRAVKVANTTVPVTTTVMRAYIKLSFIWSHLLYRLSLFISVTAAFVISSTWRWQWQWQWPADSTLL